MSSAESQYDERCDVFSVGMVLYELFFERRPGEALLEAAHAKDDARPGTVMMNMYIYEGKRPALNESAVLPSCVAAVDAGASAPASAVDASPPAALPQGAVAVSSSDAVAVAQNIINVGRRRSSGSDGGVAVGSGAAARIVALIARCWAQEPADRPTALEVLAELEAIERDHVA